VVDSISKPPVGGDTAAAVVEAAFGDAVSLVSFTECTEGWDRLSLFLVKVIECSCRSSPTDETEQFARPMLDAVPGELGAR
jgi:hypothetical protein